MMNFAGVRPREQWKKTGWGIKSNPVMWGLFHKPWNKDPYETTCISMESKAVFFPGSPVTKR